MEAREALHVDEAPRDWTPAEASHGICIPVYIFNPARVHVIGASHVNRRVGAMKPYADNWKGPLPVSSSRTTSNLQWAQRKFSGGGPIAGSLNLKDREALHKEMRPPRDWTPAEAAHGIYGGLCRKLAQRADK